MIYGATVPRTRLIDGDEVDAIEHRKVFRWRAGDAAAIKARINRRERRIARTEIRKEVT